MAELLALQEGTVQRLCSSGVAESCPAAAIRAGDRILLARGERLRLDGVVDSPEALVDTAATSGESLPRLLRRGEALAAGAVNLGDPFVLRVTAALADGSLAAMARLLERAEQARGRFVSIADKAARFYVPAAHAVALATFLGWWLWVGVSWQAALVPAVAALIITCPCGLAIAVPAVQVAASGALFRRGVLVASATALERLAGAGHVVLDKTGTLTEGRPVLLEEPGRPPRRCARRRRWRGPRATRWRARWWRPAPTRPRAGGRGGGAGPGPPPRRCAGGGPEGETRLGSAPFIGLPQEDEGLTLWLARPGLSPVPFRFADRLREDAAPAVAALRELGLEAELLSGDAPPAVEAAAHATGIGPWQARATPEGKAERIAALSVAGHRPLMVGDGINDAAALALAHVSATPQGATDLAQGAADLVLRGEGLGALPYAIRVARRAQRLARQNIAFSLIYNMVAVPCAVLGYATPLIAALVMASSSIIVILNALRAGKVKA
ncbi:HAD-IC family P-type ATPase [Teichococcus aestuarii]|uniref:HAD-IC family P-type ATPase n=1 Tax=Teichococcus aestuarii TaxID=568898 RepID=UPI00360B59C0